MSFSGAQVTRLGLSGTPRFPYGSFAGKTPGTVARPTFTGTIPDITLSVGDADLATDLTTYFTNATSYTIDPSVETGWSFTAGTLTVDADYGFFGPYVVTGTNTAGGTKSNEFNVEVTFTSENTPAGKQRKLSIDGSNRNLTTDTTNRTMTITKTNRKLN